MIEHSYSACVQKIIYNIFSWTDSLQEDDHHLLSDRLQLVADGGSVYRMEENQWDTI